jgi:hypothetical protein
MLTFNEWLSNREDFFAEEVATWDQIADKDALYATYFDTYSDANEKSGKGLKPWSKSDFEWRASKWTYAGILPKEGVPQEQLGFVTAREKNGVLKLTGMQGPNTKGKIKGLMELVATGKPIWGAMDKDFTDRLKKAGFSTPPKKAMEILLPIIQADPQFSSGGEWGSLNADGGINFELSGIGSTVKYFTANKQFYQLMFEKMKAKGKLSSKLLTMLQKWPSMGEGERKMTLGLMSMTGMSMDEESLDWFASTML